MTSQILVDTGPLVAILSRRDAFHKICAEQLQTCSPPLLTCWPVVTEAAWLLRDEPRAIQKLLGSFETGLLKLLTIEQEAAGRVARFLQRYRTTGAQLADAALLYLAEREEIETIFTLDRHDFSVYGLSGNRRLNIVPPF